MRDHDRLTLLAVLAFVLIAGIPPLLLLLYYGGFLRMPALSAGAVSFAAVAGLFVLAAFFVAAMFAKAARKSKQYEWEAVFPARDEDYQEVMATAEPKPRPVKKDEYYARQREVGEKSPAIKIIAALAIIALLAILVASTGSLSGWKQKFFGNQSNATEISVETPSVKVVKVEVKSETNASSIPSSVKRLFAAAKNKVWNLTKSANAKIQQVPYRVWAIIASVATAVLLIITLVVSKKTGQLQQVPAWIGGWIEGAKSAAAAAWRNKLKALLILIAIMVVAVGVAAFVFREKLGVGLSGISASSARDVIILVRNFALVYRLYILIGIFALLVVIGLLFLLEKRAGKGKG